MAQNDARLQVVLEAKIDKLTERLSQANSAFHRTAASIDKRQRELDKNLAKLGDTLGRGLDRASLVAGVAFGAIVAGSIEAAKRAEAVNGAFEQTFRAMPKEAAAATAGIAKEFSRLETDVKENFTQLSSVMTALGVSGTQTLSVVDQLQRRSLDIAAFKDVSDAQAFQAVISGITGETEPLKRFGIVVNETAVKAELLKLGFKGNSTEASEAAKVIARANIILRQSGEMAGQVARESDTLAEQQKRTRTEFLKTAEEFGQQFLPVAKEVLQWATDALKAFNDLPTGTQNAALGLLALVAAGGPIVAVIKGLKAVITAAVAARAALAGLAVMGGAGAAGGAAGVLGKVAKKGVAGAIGGAAAVGTLAYTAGSIPAQRQDEAEQLRRLRKEAADIPTRRAIFYDREKALAEVNAKIAVLEARQAAVGMEPPAATTPAVPDFGGFDLTPDLLKPVAGSGGAGKAAASKAAADAARAADLALSQQERTDALIGRANEDLIAARNELVVGAEARYQAEIEALEAARVARAKELDYAVKQQDLTEAQRKRVDAAEEAVRLQDEANASRRRDFEVAREQLDLRLADIDTQGEIAAIAAQMATTAAARRNAELRLLDLADQRERAELEAITAINGATAAEVAIAQKRLASLDATRGAREEGIRRDTAGPLEDYLARIPQTADEVNESMQRLAVDGLESLSTGLADAIVNAEDLGDVAKNVFRQMVADMLAASLRKNLASAGAELLKFLPIGKNAMGTDNWAGGLSMVGERGPELVNLPKGSQVIPNDILRGLAQIRMSSPGASHATLKMEVNVVGAIGADGIAAIAKREAQRGAAFALQAANKGYPTAQARQQRLGTT